jgi:hypothetical protein
MAAVSPDIVSLRNLHAGTAENESVRREQEREIKFPGYLRISMLRLAFDIARDDALAIGGGDASLRIYAQAFLDGRRPFSKIRPCIPVEEEHHLVVTNPILSFDLPKRSRVIFLAAILISDFRHFSSSFDRRIPLGKIGRFFGL